MSDYSRYLREAYRKMLLEKDFDISQETLDGAKKWVEGETNPIGLGSLEDVDTDEVETINLIDPHAYTENEMQDDYTGKVVLECLSCHSTITLDESEVYVDEETGTACPSTECPICHSTGGYNVIGKIEKYEAAETEEPKIEFPVDSEAEEPEEEVVEESLHNKIRRRTLGEAKEEVCPHCGKNPCECESLEESHDLEECGDKPLTEAEDNEFNIAPGDTDECYVEEWWGQGAPDEAEFADYGLTVTEIDRQGDQTLYRFEGPRSGFEEAMDDGYFMSVQYGEDEGNNLNESKTDVPFEEGKDCEEPLEECGDEKLTESVNNLSLDTDDQHLEVQSDETGRISVVSEPLNAPIDEIPDTMVPGEDSIVPLDNSDVEDIENNISPEEQEEVFSDEEGFEDELGGEEAPLEEPTEEPVEDDFGEEEFEVEEESFDYLGNTFAKKLYENVNSYKTTKASEVNGDLIIEGLITFNSGKQKKTKFIFNEAKETRTGRIILEGTNTTFFDGKAFKLRGKVDNGKFISEALKYNYSINTLNESTGSTQPVSVRGTVRTK